MVELGQVYLDPSVVIRHVLSQPGALEDIRCESAVASELLAVEVSRTVDNLRVVAHPTEVELTALRQRTNQILGLIELVPLHRLVLARARMAFPTPIKTLDALHLASALVWAEYVNGSVVLLTHNRQLATAARACGLAVHPEPV